MSSNKSTINSAQKKFKNKNLITTEIIHISNEHLPTILEVSFTETLNVTPHIDNLITNRYLTFHALKINRVYELFGTKLYDNIESSRRARMNDAAPSGANHTRIKEPQLLIN